MSDKLLTLKDVKAMTTLSHTTIYSLMNSGEFPRSIKLGKRAVAWLHSDVMEWINTLKKKQSVTLTKTA